MVLLHGINSHLHSKDRLSSEGESAQILSNSVYWKDLAAFLSRFFRIPAVDPVQLSAVDPQIIACISRELAEKYKIVPFKKERNRLLVAVSDPLSMSNEDELRFITGYDLIFFVLTELGLLFALEKYYGIERNLRYISVFTKGKAQEPTKEDIKTELNKL